LLKHSRKALKKNLNRKREKKNPVRKGLLLSSILEAHNNKTRYEKIKKINANEVPPKKGCL